MFNKKKWQSRPLFLLAFIISLFIGSSEVNAQEVAPFISTVNIHDVKYKQVDNTFEMDFFISNKEGVQPGVQFGVLLKQKTAKGDVVIDEKAESEVLTLGPGEQVVRRVNYMAPKVLDGDYSLFLVAKNSDGNFFAIQKVGDFKLIRTSDIGVYIDPTSCYLTISGDESGTRYYFEDAVALDDSEVLTSHCVVENIGSAPLELNPLTATYRRSVFGSEIQTQDATTKVTKLNPKEKIEISTELPRATDPQSYVVRLGYGFMSNTVMYNYAVRGESGSVRNIRLDKDGYKTGETASILFDWSGPADNLFTSRGENDSKLQDPKVFISLNTKTGESCGESVLYSLAGSRSHTITMPITVDCPEPDVSVVLSDSVSGALSEYMYAIDKTPEKTNDSFVETTNSKFMFYVYMLAFVSVLAIALLIVLTIKKNKNSAAVPPIAALVLLVGSLFMFAPSVQAESIEFGQTRFVSFTATLDKAVYQPNETIRVTGMAYLDSVEDCGDMGLPANCNANKSVSLTVNGQTVLSGNTPPVLNGSLELNAGSTLGNNSLQFTATNQGVTRTFMVSYQVADGSGSNSGSGNSSGGGTGSGSSSGSGTSGVYSVSVIEPQICSPETEKGAVLTWTVPQGQYALFTSPGYPSVMVQGSGVVNDFPATLNPVTLNLYSCTGNTESTCTELKDTVIVKGTATGCSANNSGAAVQFCGSGDSGCPVITASGTGVSAGTAFYPGYSVLFGKTLPLSVSGLSNGAKICQVFRVHPNSSYVPTPLSHAQQYCTFESNYTPVTVSGGVARLDIPQVDPDYAIDAVYQVCFKNDEEGSKASCKYITVTPFGNGGEVRPGDGTMHCDSNDYGPDIMVYGLHGGVHRIGEEQSISMNPWQDLGNARARWTVSAVEYNASPGDSVSFSRSSGTFDSNTNTSNPNNQFGMTVHGKPRTVGIKITATTDGVTCGHTSFSAYSQANFFYATAGDQYQCVGTRPDNTLYGANGNTIGIPNTPWKHRAVTIVNNLNKCEFRCGTGLKWSNPTSNLWSDGSCVPDDFTPKWHIVNATGGATCDAWQENQIKGAVEGGACNSEQANRFHNACNSVNGNRYSCVYPEGAEPAENTWTVDLGAYIGHMAGAVDTCPASYSSSMSGQSCNQPGYMCYVANGDSSYGDVYSCGNSIPHIGVGKVVDYQTGAPVSGVKVYRSHSGAVLVGFDDGLCALSNSSGLFRAEVRNMGATANQMSILSGTPTGPISQQSCYNSDYVYWSGGEVLHDQATLQDGEMIIPVNNILVRRTTATTQKSDLVSTALEVPSTAFSGKPFTVKAQSKNIGTGSTDVEYKNTFSYKSGENGNWNTLQTFTKPKLAADSIDTKVDTYTLTINTKEETELIYIKHCVNAEAQVTETDYHNNCTERGPIIVSRPTGKIWSKTAISDSIQLPTVGCDASIIKQPRLGAACSQSVDYSCVAGDFVYKCVSEGR